MNEGVILILLFNTEANAVVVLPSAELFQIMLFVTVGEDCKLYIPPPKEPAEFPEKVQFVTVGEGDE